MIAIILIGHAHISREMRVGVEHVLGPQAQFESLDVEDSDQPEHIRQQLQTLIEQLDSGHGVLIFADMFGGTPCNVALSFTAQNRVDVISGFNLPAVIKAVSMRKQSHPLSIVAREALTCGRQYMQRASELMEGQADTHA